MMSCRGPRHQLLADTGSVATIPVQATLVVVILFVKEVPLRGRQLADEQPAPELVS